MSWRAASDDSSRDQSYENGRMTITVGVPTEHKEGEHRVAITPDGVHELRAHDVPVLLESGAGLGSSITDDDYARAGIPLLPVTEPDGRRTGRQALLYATALWPVSILPAVVGLADWPYSTVATLLGAGFIGLSAAFARDRSLETARRLFFYSIIYLPLLLGALVVDRLWW